MPIIDELLRKIVSGRSCSRTFFADVQGFGRALAVFWGRTQACTRVQEPVNNFCSLRANTGANTWRTEGSHLLSTLPTVHAGGALPRWEIMASAGAFALGSVLYPKVAECESPVRRTSEPRCPANRSAGPAQLWHCRQGQEICPANPETCGGFCVGRQWRPEPEPVSRSCKCSDACLGWSTTGHLQGRCITAERAHLHTFAGTTSGSGAQCADSAFASATGCLFAAFGAGNPGSAASRLRKGLSLQYSVVKGALWDVAHASCLHGRTLCKAIAL
jgi:hypothetical protein